MAATFSHWYFKSRQRTTVRPHRFSPYNPHFGNSKTLPTNYCRPCNPFVRNSPDWTPVPLPVNLVRPVGHSRNLPGPRQTLHPHLKKPRVPCRKWRKA